MSSIQQLLRTPWNPRCHCYPEFRISFKPIVANVICSEISGFWFWTDYGIETSNMHNFHWPKGLVWVVQGVDMLKISSAMMGQGWDGTKYVGHNQCKTGPRRDTSRETLLITYSHMHNKVIVSSPFSVQPSRPTPTKESWMISWVLWQSDSGSHISF